MAMAMAVIVVMMVVAVMMIMVVIMPVARFQKVRLDFQNAVEIERAALEHIGQRHLAAFGTMQLGIWVDAPNPCLDFGKLRLRDKVGLVEHDDVGERDLVLGFRLVL